MACSRVYFPLKSVLVDALKNLDYSVPEFVDVSDVPGLFEYCVRFSSEANGTADLSLLSYPRGYKSRDRFAAENAAAQTTIFGLRYDESITVADYSYADYLRLKRIQSQLVSSLFEMERLIMRCCYDLRDVLREAADAHTRCSMLQLPSVDMKLNPLMFSALLSRQFQIEEFYFPADKSLASLTDRAHLLLDEFGEDSHYVMSTCLPQKKVVPVCLKMMLSTMLDILSLPSPSFGVRQIAGGFFRGYVKMHMQRRPVAGCVSETVIFGCEEACASDAEQSASRNALCFLEEEMQIDIVDYHSKVRDDVALDVDRLRSCEREINLFANELGCFCKDLCSELRDISRYHLRKIDLACSEDRHALECNAVLFETLYYMCSKSLRFEL